MAINIKNEHTSQAIAKLAAATGLSITEAVRQAVEEKLARFESLDVQVDHILAIGRDCASRLPDEVIHKDHGDILFGSDGLPK